VATSLYLIFFGTTVSRGWTPRVSRIAWFFAGIVPAVIAGMLLSDLLRRRRESHVKVLPPGWVPVMSAKKAFGRPDLRDRYDYVMKISAVSVESETLDAQIAALSTALIADVDR
jgi:hypothetical protein